MTSNAIDVGGLVSAAERSRATVLGSGARRRAEVPLRYLGQQVHLTAPASSPPLAAKAAGEAFSVARRLLARHGIEAVDIAERLGIDREVAAEVIDTPGTAPVVVLDLEDGVGPALADAARAEAGRLFRDGEWAPCLRFLRPAGVGEERCSSDLIEVLATAAEGRRPADYPVDGVVVPKVRHEHEVQWVCEVLDSVEDALSLPRHRIRIIYMIESAWGVQNLVPLALAGRDRLAGMILGMIDLSADVGVPEVRFRHPLFEWARSEMVTVCGGVGVPAIDGMTVNFPVGLVQSSDTENRERVLRRIADNYADTRHSIDMGMAGRWAGHPLQMLASMLAFRSAFSPEDVVAQLDRVERFAAAVAAGQGAVADSLSGDLLDAATDVQARMMLRRATAWGLVDRERVLAAGIVAADELA